MTNMGSIHRTSAQRENDSPFLEGFTNRFENLWNITKDHYVLMPTLTAGIITAAVIWNPVGWVLTGASLALIAYNTNKASTRYFLEGKQKEGMSQFGETVADIFLLGAGLGLGKIGQALTKAGSGTNAGVAIHLVDEVAAGILLVKQALQNR